MKQTLQGILDDLQTIAMQIKDGGKVSEYVKDKLLSQIDLAEASITDAISTIRDDT